MTTTTMTPRPFPDAAAPFVVELSEWEKTGPAQDERLKGYSLAGDMQSQQLADAMRGRVDIREGYNGLEIASTSFVGRVDLGALRIAIGPKLPTMPLGRLLRYAYRLRDLAAIDETDAPTSRHGLHDLLIELLATEVEELVHRGLARRYIPLSAKLDSPRGRILLDQVILQGGIREARLPCKHFERRADWSLNQVLRAGLEEAERLTGDGDLRRRVRQLSAMFGDVQRTSSLGADDIDRVERELTRLTAASRPALTVIRLLQSAQGVTFDSAQQSNRMPGFLFDMNRFFQRLLSRFLHENLPSAHILDESSIRDLFAYAAGANPKQRRAPAPRPDYALFCENKLHGFLDAKYRDVWERGFPPDWLYQLSIYALASPSKVSVLLYASMSPGACDERVEVRQPILTATERPASVILRPVQLPYLADLLDPDRAGSLAGERRDLARRLVDLQTRQQCMSAA